MTESAVIRIDFTPCRFYPHDTRTMRLMQVYGLHKGVLMTTFPKCAPTSCQGPVSAETPRVHTRIPPGQPHSCSTYPITPHQHTHTTGEREQRVGDTQVAGLPPHKTACGLYGKVLKHTVTNGQSLIDSNGPNALRDSIPECSYYPPKSRCYSVLLIKFIYIS